MQVEAENAQAVRMKRCRTFSRTEYERELTTVILGRLKTAAWVVLDGAQQARLGRAMPMLEAREFLRMTTARMTIRVRRNRRMRKD
jgi:hypothetical protein